jgi:hypothetical protein
MGGLNQVHLEVMAVAEGVVTTHTRVRAVDAQRFSVLVMILLPLVAAVEPATMALQEALVEA